MGTFCLTGELPGDDQDFVLWDLSDAASAQTWRLSLAGTPGILTRLEAYAVDLNSVSIRASRCRPDWIGWAGRAGKAGRAGGGVAPGPTR